MEKNIRGLTGFIMAQANVSYALAAIIKYVGLSAVIGGGLFLMKAGYDKGQQKIGYEKRIAYEIEAGLKLDEQSKIIGQAIGKTVTDYDAGVTDRVGEANKINFKAIADAAYTQGQLEGQSEGYMKGFKDAAKIPNTCFDDPKFLPDSLRDGAKHRYKTIFGSKDAAGPDANAEPMPDRAGRGDEGDVP